MSRPVPRPSLITRTTCRICGCPHLAPVLSLGNQRIAGAFADPNGDQPVQRAIPLELVRCDMTRDQEACGLIQTRHTVPGSILYSSYWYRSGVNRTMTENLHGIARAVESIVSLEPGDLVVDIGCNDGTLLDGYQSEGLRYLGFDPSDVSRYAVEKGYDVIRDFYSAEGLRRRRPDQKAKAITSIAMFYDLEHPALFVDDVAAALSEGGIWVIELHYLPAMLAANAFDAIVHEHLEYYSLAVIERLVGEGGFEVVAAELNDMNGGSIRLFIGHRGDHQQTPEQADQLQKLRVNEFELALDAPEPYEEFRQRVEKVRDDLLESCQKLRGDGKKIHVYGASTKGNTILQYAGIDHNLIEAAADRNRDKWGSETIGTHIPIVSEEESRAAKPDYYLVLPWHFLDEFVERESEFLAGGGRFIVPLPEVRIIEG
ncbi:MAG TPA: class I SAM-dependent methyltransferase [Solirubrobacteraceae bacterium]|nr:class I SAM-dependent methyltransferase [Solirubrobacteraceae bacterium]